MDNAEPFTAEEEAERAALAAAVAEALTDPRPSVPHEVVRAILLKKIDELEIKVAAHAAK